MKRPTPTPRAFARKSTGRVRITDIARTLVRTVALAACTAGVLGGCGDGTGPEDVAAGSYTLESANGEPLPTIALTRTDETGTWEVRILSGTLELNAGGYSASFLVDVLLDGETSLEEFTFSDEGSYAVAGDKVTLTSSDPDAGDPVVGTLDGDVLTLAQPVEGYGTFTAVFRR